LRGVGPHVIRHIVATDYLKRFPGAYQMVSFLLNDTLQTVLKEYGHLGTCDVRRQVADADKPLRARAKANMRKALGLGAPSQFPISEH
jgi:hypothetical protein